MLVGRDKLVLELFDIACDGICVLFKRRKCNTVGKIRDLQTIVRARLLNTEKEYVNTIKAQNSGKTDFIQNRGHGENGDN